LVLPSEVVDPTLHSSTFTLGHCDITPDSTKLNIMLLDSSGVLINQPGVVHLDLVEFSLRVDLFCLDHIERLRKFLLTIQCLLVLSSELLQLGLKIPVLLLISILAFVKGLEALLESL
jgi:hypothetical protein